MDADPSETVVLTGIGDAGLEWAILAREMPNGESSTFIQRSIGDQAATSGFMGPKLNSESPIHFWTGKADGTPFFVLARTDPQVEAVIAVGASGAKYPLQMSGVVEQFGLRFGATPIPDDDTLVSIRTLPPSPVHPVMRPFRPEHLPARRIGLEPTRRGRLTSQRLAVTIAATASLIRLARVSGFLASRTASAQRSWWL